MVLELSKKKSSLIEEKTEIGAKMTVYGLYKIDKNIFIPSNN